MWARRRPCMWTAQVWVFWPVHSESSEPPSLQKFLPQQQKCCRRTRCRKIRDFWTHSETGSSSQTPTEKWSLLRFMEINKYIYDVSKMSQTWLWDDVMPDNILCTKYFFCVNVYESFSRWRSVFLPYIYRHVTWSTVFEPFQQFLCQNVQLIPDVTFGTGAVLTFRNI